MITPLISGLMLYGPQMTSAQPANIGKAPDLAGVLKKAVKSLGYPDSTAQAFTNEVMGWKDASGKQLMKGWKETLDRVRNDHKAGKLRLADLVDIESKVIIELGKKVRAEFKYDYNSISLDQALTARKALCAVYAEIMHITASALGYSVHGVYVSKFITPSPSIDAHVIIMIDTADKRTIFADPSGKTGVFISKPFGLETKYKRSAGFWELKEIDKSSYLSNYFKVQILDVKGLIAVRYNNRGMFYADQNERKNALDDFNKAISLDPVFAPAYTNRSTVYSEAGKYERAIADNDTAIVLDPELALAYINRAQNWAVLGKFEKAIADYSKAIGLDPDNIKNYMGRGACYSNLDRFDEAIADCDKIISMEPDNALAFLNRGDVTITKGAMNNDRALVKKGVEDLETAYRLDPSLKPEIMEIMNKLHGK